jgi:hypothetical protein
MEGASADLSLSVALTLAQAYARNGLATEALAA